MNRAILLLTCTLLGTAGCYSRQCDGTSMTVSWQFPGAAGAMPGCADAGVAAVQVYIDAHDGYGPQKQADDPGFSCAVYPNGVVLYDFEYRTYDVRLEAYDSAGQLLYATQQSVAVNHCGNTQVSATLDPQQAPLAIQYAIANTGNQCPSGSYVWFSVLDLTNDAVLDVVDGTHQPTSVPCGTDLLWDKLPFGDYRLQFIQVVQPTGNVGQPYAAVYQSCTPVDVHHVAPDAIPVTLSLATTFCQ